ncbi:MAG: hypothetical protein MUF49_13055 [Oculatellaceae cyanobacterium Prado106]|jgi:Ca2+-binding RTX toxin-like protein|nr:hypothetical protein [Oculatellaceae cyanobacterium Prado106]
MAIVQGTDLDDILVGTPEDDELLGLGGDDTLQASAGSDRLNGGAGRDTADYLTTWGDNPNIPATDKRLIFRVGQQQILKSVGGVAAVDQLQDIESILATRSQPDFPNIIDATDLPGDASIDVEFEGFESARQLVVKTPTGELASYYPVNFQDVRATNNGDRIRGNSSNNQLWGRGGDDWFTDSEGNDRIEGGDGTDTLRYFGSEPITLQLAIRPTLVQSDLDPTVQRRVGVSFIQDSGGGNEITQIERIIAPLDVNNRIDASKLASVRGGQLTADLEAQSVSISSDLFDTLQFTVENFVDVTGTVRADQISGDSADNLLEGKEGLDTLLGRDGNDRLIGGGNLEISISGNPEILNGGRGNDILQGAVAQGFNFRERDDLTGGSGADTFILGNRRNGSFYKSPSGQERERDFAKITDLQSRDTIQLASTETYVIQLRKSGFALSVIVNNAQGQPEQDLIAQVEYARPGLAKKFTRFVDALSPQATTATFQITAGEELAADILLGS